MSKTAETTYNGWKNRSTWNIMLWMDNDEGLYRYYIEQVKKRLGAGKRFSGLSARRVCLEALGETTPDGIKVTAKCVDWPAIAESMRDGVK